jgi:hypothetical protein
MNVRAMFLKLLLGANELHCHEILQHLNSTENAFGSFKWCIRGKANEVARNRIL